MILELSAFGAVRRKLSTRCKTRGLRGLFTGAQATVLQEGGLAFSITLYKDKKTYSDKKKIDFYAS